MSFLDIDSGFWELAFPGQLLLGLGLGFTFVPLANLALIGVGEHDAGRRERDAQRDPAGGRLDRDGAARHAVGRCDHRLLRRRGHLRGRPADPAVGLQAQVEGYTTAFTWAAALLVLGALVSRC